MSDRNHQHHCPTASAASALLDMRKVRYVSVLADEVTRKTRRKALLDVLLRQRTDVSK